VEETGVPEKKHHPVARRRTDKTMIKTKRTKGQNTIYKTLHRKLKIEQHRKLKIEQHRKLKIEQHRKLKIEQHRKLKIEQHRKLKIEQHR
jgi:hypothetical protein